MAPSRPFIGKRELRCGLIGAGVGAVLGPLVVVAMMLLPIFAPITPRVSVSLVLLLGWAPAGFLSMLCFVSFIAAGIGFSIGVAIAARTDES